MPEIDFSITRQKQGRMLQTNMGSSLRIWHLPLLIVHGQNDKVVPIGQGEISSKRAMGPKFSLEVEKVGCNNALTMNDGSCQKKIPACLDEAMK